MRSLAPSVSHLSTILLVILLLLSTHALRAQRTSTLEVSAIQLPDAPSPVSGAQTHLHITYKELVPLSFGHNQRPTESWIRFLPDLTGYDRRPINTSTMPNQDSKTADFLGKYKYFIGSTPTTWMAFVPTFGRIHHETTQGANDLEYYEHYMPLWAGSVILRVGQQAKAHPHITTVLKLIHPKL